MGKKQFKAESKRLLDLMINSIYTHKEIFLREIISNASDALDKLCYISLTDDKVGMNRSDFCISIKADKNARTLTVSDNGIGMNEEEMEKNLGVIANSGSFKFKNELKDDEKKTDDIDIIGQFGVGFYSAFMVSDRVKVISKAYGSEKAFVWESTGADGYTVSEGEKNNVGTDIIMYIKEDTEDENYSEFLETYRIRGLVKKYSDYIRYPIKMDIEKSRTIETDEVDAEGNKITKSETYIENEIVNSMVPIWQRSKSEVPEEECKSFYKEHFYDMEDPARVIRVSAEGTVDYKAMLFVPAKAPYGYFTKEYEKGLQLYTSGVMIMDKCADLLPEHFRFVKGVVDSQNLSLNISREILQHDKQLKVIASNLEKKIKSELKKMMTDNREGYEAFFKAFGIQLKYGIVNDFGTHKELLSDLLMFYSSTEKKLVSLSEYVSRMPEEQKFIYFASGETVGKIDQLPQTELVKDKGYEILYMTDSVDDFVVQMLVSFEEKQFKSVNDKDLGLETEEEKKEAEKKTEESKELLDFVKDSLDGKVSAVRFSTKLKSHAVCLTADGPITLEMEKYFKSLPGEEEMGHMKAEHVLEINPEHKVLRSLKDAFENDKEKARKYAEILYTQSLLIAGMEIENPAEYAELVCELM
ncbi:MAG: molecular chaperone HtpG [Ruminococcaceae bacterium]|nr:molecular chaperone HtpG [Oscillospiraceae bacterium]